VYFVRGGTTTFGAVAEFEDYTGIHCLLHTHIVGICPHERVTARAQVETGAGADGTRFVLELLRCHAAT
jgi:hypothetical protein